MNYLYTFPDFTTTAWHLTHFASFIIPISGDCLVTVGAVFRGAGALCLDKNAKHITSRAYNCSNYTSIVAQELINIDPGDSIDLHACTHVQGRPIEIHNGYIKMESIQPARVVEHKCICKLDLLISRGCQCGGV